MMSKKPKHLHMKQIIVLWRMCICVFMDIHAEQRTMFGLNGFAAGGVTNHAIETIFAHMRRTLMYRYRTCM